ncbi:glycosyltransferase family 2 protein [bacterium]|nr:glycosyltransferase family 2 protein [bacterium]
MIGSQKMLAIVPAYNEAGSIVEVVEDIQRVIPAMDVLVVNDCSTDQTEARARNTTSTVISLSFNLGIGGAVQTGFKYAAENGYDIAVQVDGDGQHMASEIPLLINTMETCQADVVIGSRFIEKKGYTTSWVRRLGVTVFTNLNSLVLRKRITDNTSGFRAYNRRAIIFLSGNYPQDYPEPESVILLGVNGFHLEEVPVQMRERIHGQSSISAVRSIYYMVKVLLAIFVDIFKERLH